MKKKIVAFTLVVAMLAICFGATYAYFMDTETVKNVMTIGNVDIEQIEQQRGENGELEAFENGKMLLPMGNDPAWATTEVELNGQSCKVFDSENVIDKFVTVKNNGNSPAYVRTIVALEAGKTAEEANKLWYNNIAMTDGIGSFGTAEDNDLFVEIGGQYYIIVVYTYNAALEAGTESVPSLTGVALYANTTKEDIANFGSEYEVLVISQAVQAADMGDNASAALDKAFGDVNAENVADWFAKELPAA